jgi:hypothetical protein
MAVIRTLAARRCVKFRVKYNAAPEGLPARERERRKESPSRMGRERPAARTYE